MVEKTRGIREVLISTFKRILSRIIQSLAIDGIFPRTPFGVIPRAPSAVYEKLFEGQKIRQYPIADELENRLGFAVDKDWLIHLGLSAQVTIKKSELNWQHGRVIYAILRRHIAERAEFDSPFNIFETGTARGFSRVCAVRAPIVANQAGTVITLDTLPHEVPMMWNAGSDDDRGAISRASLLAERPAELGRIIFLQGWKKRTLPRLDIANIDFVFLDAHHVFKEVFREYQRVAARHRSGAQIVSHDITPGKFNGVLGAVGLVEQSGTYNSQRFEITPRRGFAIASLL